MLHQQGRGGSGFTVLGCGAGGLGLRVHARFRDLGFRASGIVGLEFQGFFPPTSQG